MKIAIALSGLARLYTISAASWARIIGRYEPDIYIHSWCNNEEEEYYYPDGETPFTHDED